MNYFAAELWGVVLGLWFHRCWKRSIKLISPDTLHCQNYSLRL